MDARRQKEMKELVDKHLGARALQPLQVLDVGSYDVNGTYKPILPPAWSYQGSDIRPGPNVDIVQLGHYRIREESEVYHAVLCGQVLEHVDRPWLLVAEMTRMLRPGGMLFVSVPWSWEPHDHPSDYWRILPPALKVLMQDAGLKVLEAFVSERMTYGVGLKDYSHCAREFDRVCSELADYL